LAARVSRRHGTGRFHQYKNRPDAIAAFVQRLAGEKPIIRIAVEPTGGYEKPLVKALRNAGLPVEMVHTSLFAAYRELVGAKAKSDTSDARLLAAYAAAPAEVRGRKADHVAIPQDAVREQLSELAARRDQLKRMIHAETCRLCTVRSQDIRVRSNPSGRLAPGRRKTHVAMMQLVRQRDGCARPRGFCRPSPVSATRPRSSLAAVPGSASSAIKRRQLLVGVAPFVQERNLNAPARIHGGRVAVRNLFYVTAVTASRHNPISPVL
jgi:transposase